MVQEIYGLSSRAVHPEEMVYIYKIIPNKSFLTPTAEYNLK